MALTSVKEIENREIHGAQSNQNISFRINNRCNVKGSLLFTELWSRTRLPEQPVPGSFYCCCAHYNLLAHQYYFTVLSVACFATNAARSSVTVETVAKIALTSLASCLK